MNSKTFALVVIFFAAILGACSSMSPEECSATDWNAVGFEDGSRGLTSDYFANHRQACAKHGVTADFRAYQEGRDEGLVQYCQPGRGYDLGLRGSRYAGVCDAAFEEEFLDAYRVGYELYELRSNVNQASASIDNGERELERIRVTIRDKEALLIARETTTQNRVLLLADIRELAVRAGAVQTEIEGLIAERARHQQELENYQNTVAAYSF